MDGYAPDASSAVHLCRGLLQLRNRAAGRAGEEKARQHHRPPETEKRFSRPGLLNPIRTNYHYLREVFPRHRDGDGKRLPVFYSKDEPSLIVTLNSQPLEPERFIPLRWAETFYSDSSFLLKPCA